MSGAPSISIVVPVKVGGIAPLEGLAECYRDLLRSDEGLELIVADDSPPAVFDALGRRLAGLPRTVHFRPDGRYRTGTNGKVNNVRAAIPRCRGDYVLMVDDDYRPTPETIEKVRSALRPRCVLRAITRLSRPSFTDLVERAGMFTGLALGPGYFCGHLAFDRALVEPGFPSGDALFDELTIARELRALGAESVIVPEPWFPIAPSASGKFLQQRVRYAYEMLGHPVRAGLYAAVLPVLAAPLLAAPGAAVALAAGLTLGAALLGLAGQWRYPALAPPFTWLLAPVYFWFVPFAIWIALAYYVTGGMRFGGRRVKRPV